MDEQYFDDGMTKNIINALAGIDRLTIISRTSSFCFKHKSLPIKQVADQWGFEVIREGSVRLTGNTLRIMQIPLKQSRR